MKLVFAIPFRARPPKRFADAIRAEFPECAIIISQPANTTRVRGADVTISHLNTTLTGEERNLYYANAIMRPLCEKAATMGDLVVYLHDNVTPTTADILALVNIVERMPGMQFASAQPLFVPSENGSLRIADYPSRFVVWRAATMMQWMTEFTAQDMKGFRSSMQVIMDRMKAASLVEGVAWTWEMEITV